VAAGEEARIKVEEEKHIAATAEAARIKAEEEVSTAAAAEEAHIKVEGVAPASVVLGSATVLPGAEEAAAVTTAESSTGRLEEPQSNPHTKQFLEHDPLSPPVLEQLSLEKLAPEQRQTNQDAELHQAVTANTGDLLGDLL